MSASGPANYEYVVARVRHRRASLFGDDEYRKLLRMGTGEIARFMEDTAYEESVNRLGSRYSGVDLVEYALNRNLAKHFEDLLRWSNGRPTRASRRTPRASRHPTSTTWGSRRCASYAPRRNRCSSTRRTSATGRNRSPVT